MLRLCSLLGSLAVLAAAVPSAVAATCSLPVPPVGTILAVKKPALGDVRLSWGLGAGDGFNVWRTSLKREIPRLRAPGAPPVVRAVGACGGTPDPVCVDVAASPDVGADVIFYQVRGRCCGVEGLDPEIEAMTTRVSAPELEASMQTLVDFGTRNSCSDNSGTAPGIGAARDWIQSELAAIAGLGVDLAPYTQFLCDMTPMRENVVGWIAGDDPERLIVVGGHYDSRSTGVDDPTADAPGANDSGSQTALLIAAARAMADYRFDASVAFVAFAGEEQGLVGSRLFARDVNDYFPGATVEAMINADIVGGDVDTNDAAALQQFRLFSPGTPREVVGPDGSADDTSPARGVMRHIGHWGAAYVPAMEMLPQLREDRLGRGGDHQPFVDRAIPSVRFIETVENLDHQHNDDDLMAYITPSYAERMTQLVVASAANLARAPTPPQGMMVALQGPGVVRLSWSPPVKGPAVSRYVVAGRTSAENLYRSRVCVAGDVTTVDLDIASDLEIPAGSTFYVSVAAIDSGGHESLFAYPEYRCTTASCDVPADALEVTAKD